ncbi:hypothetical protein EJF36_09280 [Bacillus sp. HMF5848]|uniref:hypothetical protein n=1 Tax=Bacillus sp. HMF5848 TaxID=2495421 RepID=UPI000F798A9B|nr:hypothetical protein [Bacillus sp. HMF5848]RSK27051.1 hypothetical protein EJF36_09280 [Bacillus sp. HMF5848]
MIDKTLVNLLIACVGFSLVFTLSMIQNSLLTSVVRACIGFIVFFIVSVIISLMITYIKKDMTGTHSEDNIQIIQETDQEQLARPDMFDGLSEDEIKKIVTYIRSMDND